jgi:hypothetical protein
MIDNSLREEFKKVYSVYATQKENQKDETDAMNDLIRTLAKRMEVKPNILKKTIDYRYKKEKSGQDELADIFQVDEEINN